MLDVLNYNNILCNREKNDLLKELEQRNYDKFFMDDKKIKEKEKT